MLSSVELLHQQVLKQMLDELPVDQHDMTVVEWLRMKLKLYERKAKFNEHILSE